ncbi:hypothetical protein CBS76997_7063 [Aspergillus niger]|nr:hypothetical protein CBS115988_14 [Aspergillus niger]KAI2892259.1 hypothetical protein CBS11852_5875 [Aspergillus niger]KAI2947377.1 hypothetical protein CBS147321_3001 [Aspergillus niger]KAI2956169.1 hypothetical protein CBS147323_9332 [Aspergillus niger]KAI2971747.1 hypothetical protein CBS147324_4933 [Aspergillus niger]
MITHPSQWPMPLSSFMSQASKASILLCSSAMSLTRYTAPIPQGAKVVETREQLNQVVRENPETVLYDQDGGYMLKDESGTVVAIAADSLCPELDQALAEVEALQAETKLAGNAGEQDASIPPSA